MGRGKKLRILKLRWPRVRYAQPRYYGHVRRPRSGLGILFKFTWDFWTSLILEVRRGVKMRCGWHYIVQDHKGVNRVKWFWTYDACMKAVMYDVRHGLVDPTVMVSMQTPEGSASIHWDVRKERGFKP